MPIDLPVAWVWVLNVAGWPLIQLGLARLFVRLPASWFSPPAPARWERGGAVYETVFGIRRWKDRLPDGGPWVGGGFAKRSLADRGEGYLGRFLVETWRGELCHWCALAAAPVFFLWNPLWADCVMAGYAVVVNLPCILAQRHTRARLWRILRRSR